MARSYAATEMRNIPSHLINSSNNNANANSNNSASQ